MTMKKNFDTFVDFYLALGQEIIDVCSKMTSNSDYFAGMYGCGEHKIQSSMCVMCALDTGMRWAVAVDVIDYKTVNLRDFFMSLGKEIIRIAEKLKDQNLIVPEMVCRSGCSDWVLKALDAAVNQALTDVYLIGWNGNI